MLEANGISDTERFFSAPQAPPGQGAPQQNGAGGTPPSPETMQEGLAGQQPSIGAGQTNPALAGAMGGGGMGPGQGLSMSPGQFASQQIQAAQQIGVAPQ